MKPILRPSNARRRGSAVVEFALTFVVLFPLMAGVFDFGYGFFVYNQMKNAVREGARYGSLLTYGSSSPAYPESFGTAVRNMVVYGDPAGGTKPLIPHLTTGQVNLTVAFNNGVPSSVTVRVSNYSLPGVFRTFVLSKPSCTFPYTGRYAPVGM